MPSPSPCPAGTDPVFSSNLLPASGDNLPFQCPPLSVAKPILEPPGRLDSRTMSRLLLAESACAISAAFLVAPFISIIDKSIFANASGREPLVRGIVSGFKSLFLHPTQFLRQMPFILVWGVYSSTYCVANVVECLCEHRWNIDWFFPKFLAASTTNVVSSVLKDMYFTRLFASHTAQNRRVPWSSNLLYTARDSLTIYASFNLPSIVSQRLQLQVGVGKVTADTLSQLVTPCAVQFVSCPMHLLGMDLYNRPTGTATLISRLNFIKREYLGTALARVGRIFPAYGIGGVANRALRERGRKWALAVHG
ncbi:uncharacterized protein SPPG_09478 [Spizellomyces punctatus DAOM BR117]|uniref:Mitochondrial carrier n=1 Tax=Spizellomyces punctatus (strain DAOM BR117) TaxID=645134 RepID=A0A0L0H7H2_SPIPD|nr:uncharacterized protein SPPG_09478 [Spizellomyces punctatus DAOM BR117]KNC97167.1 hypothetical protein SPPG_09478 [Spizellomyces punctatus DAOM BR117]|eukprot:XP_016605207.1 hypothetical protein SPPG_09478 [Spizellomyces punctatus DAOM BR117]